MPKRFGGPGSLQQDRQHPEKFEKSTKDRRPAPRQAVALRKFPEEAEGGTSIILMILATRVDYSLEDGVQAL
jgi:hypothetical protein